MRPSFRLTSFARQAYPAPATPQTLPAQNPPAQRSAQGQPAQGQPRRITNPQGSITAANRAASKTANAKLARCRPRNASNGNSSKLSSHVLVSKLLCRIHTLRSNTQSIAQYIDNPGAPNATGQNTAQPPMQNPAPLGANPQTLVLLIPNTIDPLVPYPANPGHERINGREHTHLLLVLVRRCSGAIQPAPAPFTLAAAGSSNLDQVLLDWQKTSGHG